MKYSKWYSFASRCHQATIADLHWDAVTSDFTHTVQGIRVPTLIMAGDATMEASGVRDRMARAMPPHGADCAILEGGSHLVFYQPDVVVEIIRLISSFLVDGACVNRGNSAIADHDNSVNENCGNSAIADHDNSENENCDNSENEDYDSWWTWILGSGDAITNFSGSYVDSFEVKRRLTQSGKQGECDAGWKFVVSGDTTSIVGQGITGKFRNSTSRVIDWSNGVMYIPDEAKSVDGDSEEEEFGSDV